MIDWVASRTDLESWLDRIGRDYFVDEPTLRLPFDRGTVELLWQGANGLSVFAPLGVLVPSARAAAVDLELAALNAARFDAGVRRCGDTLVAAALLFPNHLGAVAALVIEKTITACQALAIEATMRLS